MTIEADHKHAGLEELLAGSLFNTIWRRRTHRVSRGIPVIDAGSMTYRSEHSPHPLDELEEAVLIAATGCTGLTMPDRPFQDPATEEYIMAKPNLTMDGRTAGSPDNAQGTHFFMINDSGTYYLRKLSSSEAPLTADLLIERAREAKVRVLPHRIDVPIARNFPAYLDSNRFLSNLPGTTIFVPVVDLSQQYINGLMYILTQPNGSRPTLVDDRSFYRIAGVGRWVKNGFLNPEIKIPLGVIGTLRTHIEADLLLQNLMLIAEAMGLGAWIHASLSPPILLGDPKFTAQYGKMLGFDFVTPRFRLGDILRWQVPLPRLANLRAHPVGLKVGNDYLIRCKCPPYYTSMAAAVDDVVSHKFGQAGVYRDKERFTRIYNEDFGDRYLNEAKEYGDDVIACAKDICTYIYETHGRFPAHVDAIYVPGIWLQVHHPETEYYDRYFRHGLTDVHRRHDQRWHPQSMHP